MQAQAQLRRLTGRGGGSDTAAGVGARPHAQGSPTAESWPVRLGGRCQTDGGIQDHRGAPGVGPLPP